MSTSDLVGPDWTPPAADRPTYTLTVAGATWSRTSVIGGAPTRPDPVGPGWTRPTATDTDLDDPFTHTWGFTDDQIPGQLEPSRTTFTLWSTSAAEHPDIDLGDALSVALTVGDASGPALVWQAVRVTSVEAETVPGDEWAIRTTVQAVDMLADLNSLRTNPETLVGRAVDGTWREFWPYIGEHIGRSIGCPTGWTDTNTKPKFTAYRPGFPGDVFDFSAVRWCMADEPAVDPLRRMSASYGPYGSIHCLTPYAGGGYPAGWRWSAPDTWGNYVPGFPFNAPTDPGSYFKFMLTPADRYGVTTLDLPAKWCLLPSKARRGREAQINTATLTKLYDEGNNPDDVSAYELDAVPGLTLTYAGVLAGPQGAIGRQVETSLLRRVYSSDGAAVYGYDSTWPAYTAERHYLADASVRATSWAYDAFVVDASLMTPDEAAAVLPRLVPNHPGYQGGDNQIVRHITITDIPADIQLTGSDALPGFVTSGRLSISDGDLALTLTTTPGLPRAG